jgi:hypothetical protein
VKFKDPDISAGIMDDLFKKYAVLVLYLTKAWISAIYVEVYCMCLYISGPCNTA